MAPSFHELGFYIDSLSLIDSSSYHQLNASFHKDPFDKMLIWQAICNKYTFISNDSLTEKYQSLGLRLVVEN